MKSVKKNASVVRLMMYELPIPSYGVVQERVKKKYPVILSWVFASTKHFLLSCWYNLHRTKGLSSAGSGGSGALNIAV